MKPWRGYSFEQQEKIAMISRILAVMLALLIVLGTVTGASAQAKPSSAELKRVVGRVEVLKKGQAQWLPAVVGARLVEGDDIRAFASAMAEMTLPDGSTVMVAENSRVIVTKLDFDPQNQGRVVLLHLVVGKVLASVTHAAITLVRARQSNFAITTPTAVAAVRGTLFEVTHDGTRQVTRMAVLADEVASPPGQGKIEQ
jgi:hypothetical protein